MHVWSTRRSNKLHKFWDGLMQEFPVTREEIRTYQIHTGILCWTRPSITVLLVFPPINDPL